MTLLASSGVNVSVIVFTSVVMTSRTMVAAGSRNRFTIAQHQITFGEDPRNAPFSTTATAPT